MKYVSAIPVVICIIHHRIVHQLHSLALPLLARIIAELAHSATGIDIHPGATIGANFFIDHGTGVVIGRDGGHRGTSAPLPGGDPGREEFPGLRRRCAGERHPRVIRSWKTMWSSMRARRFWAASLLGALDDWRQCMRSCLYSRRLIICAGAGAQRGLQRRRRFSCYPQPVGYGIIRTRDRRTLVF